MPNNRRPRNRSKGNRGGNHKKKFTGQSQDVLEGHVITEDCTTPLPRQYDSFWKAVDYATGTTNPDVCQAIERQKPLEMKDFMPDKGKEMESISEWFEAFPIKGKEAMLKTVAKTDWISRSKSI
jgi:hypothetical protein